MPRYIEQLTENITPATGDWLWIVDVSAEATDQDRKLSVGKLALATGISGGQTINGGTAANDDLTLEGTSHGTKTTSHVILQPTSGNVGIGTTAPGAKLDVNGKIISSSVTAGGKLYSYYSAASKTYAGIGQDMSGTGYELSLFAPTTGSLGRIGLGFVSTADGTTYSDKMVIQQNGNVLIGTTTDVTSAVLQVGGTTGALLVSRLTTTQRIALSPTNGMILYNSSTNKFQGYEAGEWVNLI